MIDFFCSNPLQLDPGFSAPPAVRPSPGGGRGRGRGRSSDQSLVTVTGIFPKETVGANKLCLLIST